MDVVGGFLESCRLRSSTPMVTSPATFYTRWVLGQVTHRMCRSLGFDPLSIGSLWNSDGERVLSISPWEAKQFSYGSSWAWYVLPYLHGRWWEKSIEIRSANSIEAGLLGIIGCVLGVLGMLMDVDGCYTKIYSRNVDVAPEVWSIKNVVCGIVCLLALAWTAPKFGPEDVTPVVVADSRVECFVMSRRGMNRT